MPIYEYECAHGHRFEIEQRITDAALSVCPEPAGNDAPKGLQCTAPCKRLISGGGGFQLSGSGWAKDGYK